MASLLRPLALALLIATPALAQHQAEPPKPAAPAEQPAAPSAAAEAKFPATPSKQLFAKNDLRNKKAPALHVEKWISEKPELKDKVVLYDFWATWCGPCKRLIPELQSWQKKFEGDLVVVGISDEKEPTVRAFYDKQKISYPMAIDTKGKMKSVLKVEGIPHVMVVGSDGVVRWQGLPNSPEDTLTEEKLAQIIAADKAARAKKTSNKPQTAEPAKAAQPAGDDHEKKAPAPH